MKKPTAIINAVEKPAAMMSFKEFQLLVRCELFLRDVIIRENNLEILSF